MPNVSSFTPGPWCLDRNFVRANTSLKAPVVAHCPKEYLDFHGLPKSERDANAQLISAAPDLLNALIVLVHVAESRGIPTDAARAAIAKATGIQL